MNSDTKDCPFCGETIKAAAIKCRHCGEFLVAATAPAAAPAPPARQEAFEGPLETAQILDLLVSLVDRNLVVYEENANGRGRYRLLETVRHYARERLMENGAAGAETVAERHLAHFLALAEQASQKMRGPEQKAWLDALETEHDNLRAALQWCLEDEKGSETGLRLSGALAWFWMIRAYLHEGRERSAAALARPFPQGQGRTRARAAALTGAGILAKNQGDLAAALPLFEESLALFREMGDQPGAISSLQNLGNIAFYQGDFAAARAFYEESLALSKRRGDKDGVARSLTNLGFMAYSAGDYATARALGQESLAIKQELGDRRGVAGSLNNLGGVAFEEDDFAAARAYLTQSLAISRELGDKSSAAGTLNNLAGIASKEGDFAAAHAFMTECLTLLKELGDPRLTAEVLETFSGLLAEQEQPEQSERATRLFGVANALRQSIGAPLPSQAGAHVDHALADLRTTLGEAAFDAAWAAGRALTWEQAVVYALEDKAL